MPVLIDFGFAECYDTSKQDAFVSNLSYGTPEVRHAPFPPHSSAMISCLTGVFVRSQYLSPERAKGQKHDTRKSDVWALGVTFFEVLVGRTPFERAEGEPMVNEAMLRAYWERTVSPYHHLRHSVSSKF